ncbi:class I SAM-dependent methyltransferase [Methylobacterium ajmalii]|uniref:Class I SAM-dependent methyltransferase n=1 Tax=Methylobacterium ajmalii TaxID=2738439 RepID=A0ABU9ZTD3_9HYPH
MLKTPLNQTYKMQKTFLEYPNVKSTYDLLTERSTNSPWNKRPDGYTYPWGRRYDYAVLTELLGDRVVGGKIADLGARDGFFGSYLSERCDVVHISDYFEEWGKGTDHDLGDLEKWSTIWKDMATNPDRIVCESQDITSLTYEDNSFDIVICTSVIEHIRDKDQAGMAEIVRICKPGGLIAMSTDMSDINKWHSGTFYYNEESIYDRLIIPHPVRIMGRSNFEIDHADNDQIDYINHEGLQAKTVAVVFCLEKH